MRTILFIMLFLWLLTFLWLALWPFDFTRKNLASFDEGRGLQFTPPSIALSDGAPSKIAGLDTFAIMLRFFPARNNGSGCILDYAPIETATNLRILEEKGQLDFAFRVADVGMKHFRVPLGNPDNLKTYLCIVRRGSITIMDSGRVVTSRETQTEIGSRWNRQAELIFGCTASGKLRWRGTLVSFEVHRAGDINSIPDTGSAILSYQFPRHKGRMIPDIGREPHIPLLVPTQVIAPARKILSSPLTYWDGQWNTSDVFYNLIAFLPLGVLLGLLFKMRMRKVMLVLAATGVACLISLSVESAQYLVSWRDSSIVDVFTNSFGTFCGAWLSTSFTNLSCRSSP
jgi:hypothetical protein